MADQHDAQLLVQLAQWGTALGFQHSVARIMAEDFNPETAAVTDPDIAGLLQYFETIGTLTKNNLLDEALVLDWVWVSGVWNKLGPAATRMREQSGMAKLYENFEALASKQG